MLARAHAFTIDGLQTRHVSVEVDVRAGLPCFAIVGLADAAVREARERVTAAILNSGYEFPKQRITANLAPGDVRKAGPGLDLALACAVRPSHGALAIAHAARRAGMRTLALAPACVHEAQLIEGLDVAAVAHLRSAARVLGGGPGDPVAEPRDGGARVGAPG